MGPSRTQVATYAGRVRSKWLSRRAVTLHVRLVLIVLACSAFAWWQVTRALGGNGLSWFYVVEWPVFGGLAVAGWWHLLNEDPEHFAARKRRPNDWEVLEDPYRSVS